MKETFLQYAKKISSQKNILEIIRELKDIFAKEGMFHEEAGCLEKIWHITHDPKLYEEIGDTFFFKADRPDIVNFAYCRYLYYSNPEFYKKFTANLKKLGQDFPEINSIEDKQPQYIIDLCDRYLLIVYIILCLFKKKNYKDIFKTIKYLLVVKNKIVEFNKMDINDDKSYMDEIFGADRHLSEVLSEEKDDIEINKLSIELNSKNKQSHVNILSKYLTDKKYDEAFKFYNEFFAINLGFIHLDKVQEICWLISDYYRDKFRFYDALRFIRIAINLDLEDMNNA